mgnify:CR=1 FL=1
MWGQEIPGYTRTKGYREIPPGARFLKRVYKTFGYHIDRQGAA